MSWNKELIVVLNIGEMELQELFGKTGFQNLLVASEITDFQSLMKRNYEGIPFGIFHNHFWILSPGQTFKMFNDEKSTLEKNLCKKFPETTFLALSENGTVYAFGFNVTKNGHRIRVLSGCDGDYYYEHGEPLEIEVANESQVRKEFSFDDYKDQEEFEKQVKFEAKWRTAFDLLVQEAGISIDEVYEANPNFTLYKRK